MNIRITEHLTYTCHRYKDRSLEKSEKADGRCAKSKYPDKITFAITAGAGFEGNNTKGENETMKMKCMKKMQSLFLSMMLIVAMALCMTGCNGKEDAAQSAEITTQAEGNVLGEGATQFDFVVVDKDGNETEFEIHTDKETVGEALQDVELIAGEDSEFGLYVKTVNGITADYDTDGTYWAFYVNGEYASTGVDSTVITEGDVYSFKVE